MEKGIFELDHLSLSQCASLQNLDTQIVLSQAAKTRIQASHDSLQRLLSQNKVIYGINTGFGKLASQQIADDELSDLQHNLVKSHMVGTGKFLPSSVVRLILLLKINALAQGYSGVRLELVESLILLFNKHYYPQIPCQGSVGASGDLAPLAHLSGTLLGLGHVEHQGQSMTAQQMLEQLDIQIFPLAPKEGLALLNGTQVSTAIALAGFQTAIQLFESAIVSGCLSVDAACGSDKPFDERIHKVRSQEQTDVAQIYRDLLQSSDIRDSHQNCGKVQDPYSIRCQPQVMGAVLANIRHAGHCLQQEINAVTDNPLIFAESDEVLSGGNFHAQAVAFACDALACAIAEIGSLSERRVALLMDKHLSGLPEFLIENPGVNSGFMIAQVTAAALVHENKQLAVPSSVDSIPTSANQEDHVSMATYAARRLLDMNENLAGILAIEMMTACQGLDFRKPLTTSMPLQVVFDRVRSKVPYYQADQVISEDLNTLKQCLINGEFSLSQFSIASTNYSY